MMRVVLDANVVVSGVLGLERDESVPGAIWRHWRNRDFTLLVGASLVAEVERALRNPYFSARIRPELAAQVVAALVEDGTFVALARTVAGVATHPEDDLVLATAVSAEADYLVTGDKQLLQLGGHGGTDIIDPRTFLKVLRESVTR
jgi:putative PIN family toxin of toxin-antitoxin system